MSSPESSPSSSEDSFADEDSFFEENSHPYSLYKFTSLDEPTEDKDLKKVHLIAAVVQNNLTFLKRNLNSPEWYQIQCKVDGCGLLHFAIMAKNKEIFDYLLSLEDFALDLVNSRGQTALALSLSNFNDFNEYASCQLIQKGALQDESILHSSIETNFVQVSKLLMEKGYDVNALSEFGSSPLTSCLDCLPDESEIELVTALLSYGADPTLQQLFSYNMFEYVVMFSSISLRETLYYYMFDRYTSMNVHLEVLLTLAEENSPLFKDVIGHTKDVVLGDTSLNYYYMLFFIDCEFLKALIEKCSDVIREVFVRVSPSDYRLSGLCDKISLDNLNLLLENNLKWDTLNFIVDLSNKFYFNFLIGCGGYDGSVVMEILCCLLSYGLKLNLCHLQYFYRKYGYGELLKILLHMDLESTSKQPFKDVMLFFIYDINMDVEKYLRYSFKFRIYNVHELLYYFVDRRLDKFCDFVEVRKELYVSNRPQIPLLVEMARNVFRKYFVQRLKIKNAKEFYTVLNSLPISTTHKKIITYETKLY